MKFVKRPGHCRAFSFCRRIASPPTACKFLAYAYFYLVPFRTVRLCALGKPLLAERILTPVIDRARFGNSNTAAPAHRRPPQGYPSPTSKKKRACVVTYRHSGEGLFENCFPPHFNVTLL